VNDYHNPTRDAPGFTRRAAPRGAARALAVDRPATTGMRTGQLTPRCGVLIDPIGRRAPLRLPCQVHDEDLWFADEPGRLEQAKKLCTGCPALQGCLAGAVRREEPAGRVNLSRPRSDGSKWPRSVCV
jgi:WhiB family redox-sensing transcriptional regulator